MLDCEAFQEWRFRRIVSQTAFRPADYPIECSQLHYISILKQICFETVSLKRSS